MRQLAVLLLLVPTTSDAGDRELQPIRIAVPVNGHIHPAICVTQSGTLVVTFGRVNHVDLRMTRSLDGGITWSPSIPFAHTVKQTYYPGSLTTLSDGRILHCWNRWNTPTTQEEPRSVIFSLSDDDGVTWSDPQPFPRNPEVRTVIRHPICELQSKRWLVSLWDRTIIYDPKTAQVTPFGDGRVHGLVPIVQTTQQTFISGAGLRSTDHGRTWQTINNFPDIKTQGWRHEMICLRNGWLLASEIPGPGFGGNRIQYRISYDDGQTWDKSFEYYNPGRPINGRACPRTVQLDDHTIGVVFYDIDKTQQGGPGLFFLRIPLAQLANR